MTGYRIFKPPLFLIGLRRSLRRADHAHHPGQQQRTEQRSDEHH
ncbi:MAG TPA: hypothetical protein VD835_18050 [Pyrinomonadaceae bacterium]|nr:hypothetical protein [Pyrinomonadaceae bacterium]